MNFEQYTICMDALRVTQKFDETVAQQLYKITFGKAQSTSHSRGRGRPQTPMEELLKWDWTKTNRELSAEKGISIASITNYRRRVGIPHVGKFAPMRKLEERRKWDWSLSDIQLAAIHKITRERVRQIRAQLGFPASHAVEDVTAGPAEAEFMKWVNGRDTIIHLEAVRAGHSISMIRFWCKKNGIRRILRMIKNKHPWDSMNWDLPNRLLSKAWNVRNQLANKRSQLGKPKAIFSAHGDITSECQAALDAEIAKAKQWRESQKETA